MEVQISEVVEAGVEVVGEVEGIAEGVRIPATKLVNKVAMIWRDRLIICARIFPVVHHVTTKIVAGKSNI
jgi:hypothetical protein